MSTPLGALKPNRQQDGLQGGIAGNVASEGPITRTWKLPSAMSAGAGDRASTGSPHLSFDGSRGGAPINSPQTSPVHGSAYGIVTPTSPRGSTTQYGRSAHHFDISRPAKRPVHHFDIGIPASESS